MTLIPMILMPLAYASDYGDVINVDVVRVYDGDTITVNIPTWPSIIGNKIGVRIFGIDTPELRTKCAEEKKLAIKAREFVKDKINKANSVDLKEILRGKYFRIVAKVLIDNKDISDVLIAQGLAVPYFGGTKKHKWCEPMINATTNRLGM